MFESQKDPVSVLIAAVAFSDGSVVVPDGAKLANTLNAFVAAQRDVEAGIALTSGRALQSYLNDLVAAGRAVSVHTNPYEARRSYLARQYFGQLQSKGEAEVRAAVSRASARLLIPTLRSKP